METAARKTEDHLREEIKQLGPWHLDIEVTDRISTRVAEGITDVNEKQVSLISPQQRFFETVRKIYPNGLVSKTFLDCACNAGGYCFWSSQLGAEKTFGFDVREHWINQAKFLKENCSVMPTDRTEFRVLDLYDLPKQGFSPFDMTMFKGIFYHLPDPVTGLKNAADLTKEVMWFNSQTLWDVPDGSLKLGLESTENVMSGVHRLKWYPTGPGVIADILQWLGFKEIKLLINKQNPKLPKLGRVEIIASKVEGLLKKVGKPMATSS